MTEPAKQFEPRDEENYWKPEVIEGDGEGDGKPQGDLKGVDLEKAEKAAGEKTDGDDKAKKPKTDSGSPGPTVAKPGQPKGFVGKWRSVAKWKRYASVGGIAAALMGGLFLLFISLIPLKLQFVIQNIQQKVADVPQYAVERRLEYLTSDYLLKQMGARSAVTGDNIYLGNSFVDTLYTNWKAVDYEKLIFDDMGIQIEKVDSVGRRGEASSWRVTSDLGGRYDGLFDIDGKLTNKLNSKEMRRLIKDASIDKTKSHQVLKRYNMRRVLRRKYGVRSWRVFESTRESVRQTYLEKKFGLYKTLIENTVGRVSERYGLYLTCLLKAGTNCSNIRKGVATNTDVGTTGNTDEDTDAHSKGQTEAENAADRKNSRVTTAITDVLGSGDPDAPNFVDNLVKSLRKFTLKKFMGFFVSGVGLLEVFSQIDSAIESGAISTIVADKNAQLYVGYATTFLTINDQMTSGEAIDSKDIAAVFEILEGFEESPVYQAEFGGLSDSNRVLAAASIPRDCDGDGIDETVLSPGELVCDNKKVVINAEETFTENEYYQGFSTIISTYRASAGKIVHFVLDITDKAVDVVVGDLITEVMGTLGVDKFLQTAFEFVFNWIFGATVTGAETRGDAYDAIRAGIEIDSYELMEDDQFGGGGMLLNSEQIAQLDQHLDTERQTEKNNRSFFARIFSINKDSLLVLLVMEIPTNIASFTNNIARLPLNILSTSQNLFAFIVTPGAVAQTSGFTSNPFSVLQTGYTLDSNPEYDGGLEDFVAIERVAGFDYSNVSKSSIPSYYDMDTPPDVVWTKYGCGVYVEGTPEQVAAHQSLFYGKPEGMAFEVPVKPNPCMLELMVTGAGAGIFGGELSGIDNYVPAVAPASSSSSSGSSSDPPESSVPLCDPALLPKPGDPPCIL